LISHPIPLEKYRGIQYRSAFFSVVNTGIEYRSAFFPVVNTGIEYRSDFPGICGIQYRYSNTGIGP
jgi:hypothetical protein